MNEEDYIEVLRGIKQGTDELCDELLDNVKDGILLPRCNYIARRLIAAFNMLEDMQGMKVNAIYNQASCTSIPLLNTIIDKTSNLDESESAQINYWEVKIMIMKITSMLQSLVNQASYRDTRDRKTLDDMYKNMWFKYNNTSPKDILSNHPCRWVINEMDFEFRIDEIIKAYNTNNPRHRAHLDPVKRVCDNVNKLYSALKSLDEDINFTDNPDYKNRMTVLDALNSLINDVIEDPSKFEIEYAYVLEVQYSYWKSTILSLITDARIKFSCCPSYNRF